MKRLEDGGWRLEDEEWKKEDGGWRMEESNYLNKHAEDPGWGQWPCMIGHHQVVKMLVAPLNFLKICFSVVFSCNPLLQYAGHTGCWPPTSNVGKAGRNYLNEWKILPTGIGRQYSQTIPTKYMSSSTLAPMWTTPINESAELSHWSP